MDRRVDGGDSFRRWNAVGVDYLLCSVKDVQRQK
jgi:hypothetical protein